ncbi:MULTISPECIES: hypothetical protein [Rhizobium]|uniref:hypothetical protein n=1 Tax=Rhizobium TaxID=379 RepID=UPI001043CAF3|nr:MULTISPECIES: hypothetical protein [Rhizobium]
MRENACEEEMLFAQFVPDAAFGRHRHWEMPQRFIRLPAPLPVLRVEGDMPYSAEISAVGMAGSLTRSRRGKPKRAAAESQTAI